jgi:hypothetical protein
MTAKRTKIPAQAEVAAPAPSSRRSEAKRNYWRKVREGLLPEPRKKEYPVTGNPLLRLAEKERARLFVWLRECPFHEAVVQMLGELGVPGATRAQVDEFFQSEAEHHWQMRLQRAATEADALVRLVENNVPKFSAGILAALGQEAFRQVASGAVDPDAMGKLAKLFMQARSAERADQMQELRREKLQHELQAQVEHALEKLAEEVERHPAAREAFEALRREIFNDKEQT